MKYTVLKNLPIVHLWTLGLKKSTMWHYMADIIVLIIAIIVGVIMIVTGISTVASIIIGGGAGIFAIFPLSIFSRKKSDEYYEEKYYQEDGEWFFQDATGNIRSLGSGPIDNEDEEEGELDYKQYDTEGEGEGGEWYNEEGEFYEGTFYDQYNDIYYDDGEGRRYILKMGKWVLYDIKSDVPREGGPPPPPPPPPDTNPIA